jgi:hypothetical protein
MPTLSITYDTPEERRDYERAIAFVAEMRQLGLQAPHGGVIDACEAVALSKGHDLLRDTLVGAVQARVADVEKKARRPAATRPAARGGGRGRS